MTSGSFKPDTIWQTDKNQFHLEEFGDTALVYFRPSGDTHFLSFLPADVLQIVASSPQNARFIHEKLMKDYDFEKEDLPFRLVRDAIEQLDYTGLIQPTQVTPNGSEGKAQ